MKKTVQFNYDGDKAGTTPSPATPNHTPGPDSPQPDSETPTSETPTEKKPEEKPEELKKDDDANGAGEKPEAPESEPGGDVNGAEEKKEPTLKEKGEETVKSMQQLKQEQDASGVSVGDTVNYHSTPEERERFGEIAKATITKINDKHSNIVHLLIQPKDETQEAVEYTDVPYIHPRSNGYCWSKIKF